MDNEKRINTKHFFNATVITIGFALVMYTIVFSPFCPFSNEKKGIADEKVDLAKEYSLPSNATDIQNLGNGWVRFCLKDVEIWRFRHPLSHEVAIDVLDRKRKQELADETRIKIKKLPRERRAER